MQTDQLEKVLNKVALKSEITLKDKIIEFVKRNESSQDIETEKKRNSILVSKRKKLAKKPKEKIDDVKL